MNDALFVVLWFGVQCLGGEWRDCLMNVPALPVYVEGHVTPYAPGLAKEVMIRRIRWGQLRPHYGYVPCCKAVLNDNHLDDYVIVFHEGGWTLCYVVDLAQSGHARERERDNLVLELDAESYRRIGYGPVVVSLLERTH